MSKYENVKMMERGGKRTWDDKDKEGRHKLLAHKSYASNLRQWGEIILKKNVHKYAPLLFAEMA